jgi:hypothetical protein
VYGPLAVPAWRIAFPLATLPVWALLAQLSVWRDEARDDARRGTKNPGAMARRLGMGAFVKAAVLAAVLAAPLGYLTHGRRVRALRAALEGAGAAAAAAAAAGGGGGP